MTNTSDHLEVEVKFFLSRPDQMSQCLIDLGASPQPGFFETNVCFDNSTGDIKSHDKLLRLRQDTASRLTYKCKPPQTGSQCKVYKELEITVSDFDIMTKILTELGYHQAQVYEKWRQVFTWNDVDFCMDTLPYGSFLEIEGPEASIRNAARKLHLPWEQRILHNYLAMFDALHARYHLPFTDVTFSNFEQHPVEFNSLLSTFQAGKGTSVGP